MNKEDIRLSLTFVVLSRGEQKASTSTMLTLYVEQLKFCSTNFSPLWPANPMQRHILLLPIMQTFYFHFILRRIPASKPSVQQLI